MADGDADDEEKALAAVMGFSSFGKTPATGKQADKKSDKQADKNADKNADKQADKNADKQAEKKSDKAGELPPDYMRVFEDSLRLARERNAERRPIVGPELPQAEAQDDEAKEKERKKEKKEKKKRKKEKKEKKKSRADKKEEEEEDDSALIGPPIPSDLLPSDAKAEEEGKQQQQEEEEEDEDEEEEEEELDEESLQLFVPQSRELFLDHGSGKPMVALGFDSAGSRVVTGGSDFSVRFWNFAGMDSACRPFKTLDQPCGAHQIRYVGFNCASDCVLVVSGSAQARVCGRDGAYICETVKGYQYISNPRSTPGHTHALFGGRWHPRESKEFMTWSSDNSLRVWDVNNTETIVQEIRIRKCQSVAVPKNAQGRTVAPTACAYSPDGLLLFAGCADGSLQAWDRRRHFVNNSHLVRGAHSPDTVTCLAFSYDSNCLLSRSMDDSLKLWDMRQLKSPAFVRTGISTQYEQTGCGFSPNDRLFFTAACAPVKLCQKDGRSPGQLLFFDRRTLTEVEEQSRSFEAGAVQCCWHPKINQLAVSLSDGRGCVLFDQQRSVNGAKLCAGKPARTRELRIYKGGYVKEGLLTYDDESAREVRQGKRKTKFYEHTAPGHAMRRLHQAEAPVSGPGFGGKIGQKGASLHQYMLQQIVQKREDDPAEKDIRGAILRHQADASKNPMWTGVYAKTQPNPVFSERQTQEEAEAAKKPRLF